MKQNRMKLHVLTAALLAGSLLLAPATVRAQVDHEARKARIIANLKFKFPQLEQANVSIGEITPTAFDGLDQGTLLIPGRPGGQPFLVSRDDKKFYLVNGEPIDVSLSNDSIQALIADREAVKVREAAERRDQLASVVKNSPYKGNPNAPVTIVEFSEFQCPYCAKGAETSKQVLAKYPDDVRFVFLHFPLDFHNWAKPAAIASYCAGQQSNDAFWTLHDKYFEKQRSINAGNVLTETKAFLADTKIDMAKWSACAEDTESEAHKAAAAAVDANMALGKQLGVTGTPGFFVNGHFLKGAQPVTAFEPLIEQAKNSGS